MIETIEKINIKDLSIASEILKLQKESYKIEADIINYYKIPPLIESEDDLINSSEDFIAYKIDNKICGVISFQINEKFIDIFKFFVSPQYINKGIGNKLLKYLEEKFNNKIYFKVQTALKNIPAINFYKKHNFKLINTKIIDTLEIAEFEKLLFNNIIIRKAEEKDAVEIKELLGIVWDNTYKEIIPTKIIENIKSNWHKLENLKAQIKNREKIIFNVAEENSKIIAILTASLKDNICNLSRLYILPNFQKKGIGKKLLENLISTNKFTEIQLEVEEENYNAIKFYENQGFIKIGKRKDKIMDFELKTIIMKKQL